MTNDTSLEEVDRSVQALAAGEAIIVPTDTVYGLAADPRSEAAMAQLFALKQRPEGVPVAVLVATIEQARELIQWSDEIEDLTRRHWPGALTIVGTVRDHSLCAGTGDTLGVRLPDHGFMQACSSRFGPIAATSANRHGQPTITNPADLTESFGSDVSVVIDGGVLDGAASTVVDVTDSRPKILRQGVVLVESAD